MDFLCTLCSDICIFHVRKNISDISLFGFRPYLLFLFPFLYKTKKNSFCKIFSKHKISVFSEFYVFPEFHFFGISEF